MVLLLGGRREESQQVLGPCPRAPPYLVGRHQIKVTRVCWVKLHDVVHRLPVGHRHHPPAHHLHALVQVDLWGVGGGVRVTGGGVAPGSGDLSQAWGLSLILS